MKTERLHYDDPHLLTFEARVVAHAEHRDRASVVLDRTAFYPESGGQMSDRGLLDDRGVLDVQLDDQGRLHHVLEGERPPIDAIVHGAIDAVRRREHMALHTGQHALSRALLDELDAVTVSSRLGESACTIDVDRDGLRLNDVRRAEDRVNALIDEDRPVRQLFPDDRELAALSLRKPPPDTDRVRVVIIEGFDVTPCGGTHCTHTSQIELVRIDSVERYKGGTRITFAAGLRARRLLARESDALRALAAELGCAPAEVASIALGLRRKLDEAREDAGSWRAELAAQWAARLAHEGTIVAIVERADPALLEAIAGRLATGDRLVALASTSDEGTHVLVARGPDSAAHCGEIVRAITQAAGGRGGGRPDHARGRLPAGADFPALVADALAPKRSA